MARAVPAPRGTQVQVLRGSGTIVTPLFEIAVYRQTRARGQTFEEATPKFGPILSNYAKSPKHAQNQALGCFTCSKLSPEHAYKIIRIEQKLAE